MTNKQRVAQRTITNVQTNVLLVCLCLCVRVCVCMSDNKRNKTSLWGTCRVAFSLLLRCDQQQATVETDILPFSLLFVAVVLFDFDFLFLG